MERNIGTRPPTGSRAHGSGSRATGNVEKTQCGMEMEEVEIKRKRAAMSCGIICSSLCALLLYFIQHLVKRDLFSFYLLLCRISGRSQFAGSFVKCWSASVTSLRRCRARKAFCISCDVDRKESARDCLCTILNVDWKTKKLSTLAHHFGARLILKCYRVACERRWEGDKEKN